jgi:predicted phosphate transport protein (TIGR00153 family)
VIAVLFSSEKDKQFFILLSDAARNLVEVTREYGLMVKDLDRSPEYAERLHKLENKGDRFTHDLIHMLNKQFITPLEREDLLTLGVKLDDVTDNLEAAASRMDLYKIRGENQWLIRFGEVITKQAHEIVTAMDKLQAKNLMAIRENAVQINLLENEGDDLLRDALADLFERETNPITIIKLKEIYETLEMVTDRAEDVANALESVIMKNA